MRNNLSSNASRQSIDMPPFLIYFEIVSPIYPKQEEFIEVTET
jgi:hypothetical protein